MICVTGPCIAAGEQMLRKAFVISPIGQPGSKARQQADAVLEKIIEPAAKKLEAKNIKLQVVRGEHDQSGKAILAEILDGILHYDLIIAVLFEPNPNVFYEVGVAESAGRPMLVLKHSDFPVPHDLKDVRYVEYTSRDLGGFRALDPMRADGPGALLSAAMEQRVGGKRYKWPFDRELLAALGQQNILSRFRDLTPLEWSKIILEAEKEVWLAGVTLKQLTESPAFHFPDADGKYPEEPNAYIWRLLGSAMARGVMVHLLMMHPDNPALPHMLMRPPELQQAGASELDKVRNDLAHSKDAWVERASQRLEPSFYRDLGRAQPRGRRRIVAAGRAQAGDYPAAHHPDRARGGDDPLLQHHALQQPRALRPRARRHSVAPVLPRGASLPRRPQRRHSVGRRRARNRLGRVLNSRRVHL